MFRFAGRLLVLLSLSTAVGQSQVVISVRAGLVHHLEGQVLVGNKIVSHDPDRFTRIAEGRYVLRRDVRKSSWGLAPFFASRPLARFGCYRTMSAKQR